MMVRNLHLLILNAIYPPTLTMLLDLFMVCCAMNNFIYQAVICKEFHLAVDAFSYVIKKGRTQD